jgi:aspartate aminotransferase
VDPICLLMVNSASHTASFTQRAAIAALEGPQESVTEMVAEFRRRRDLIVDGFNQIPGFRCATPGGAFYAFPNVTATGMDSRTLAERILQEAGVACLAGDSFGRYGAGYLRFSYATAYEKIAEALERIDKLMRG